MCPPLVGASSLQGRGAVLLINGERSIEEIVAPRLIAAGADMDKVIVAEADTLEEAAQIGKQAAKENSDLRAIFVDPLNAFAGHNVSNSKARKQLRPFGELAREHGIAVVSVHHVLLKAKANSATTPLALIAGTAGWPEAVANVLMCARLNDAFLIENVCGTAGEQGQRYRYEIEPCELPGGIESSRVIMDDRPPQVSILQALQTATPSVTVLPRAFAKRFLLERLANGKQLQAAIVAAAKASGISEPTLLRAKKELA